MRILGSMKSKVRRLARDMRGNFGILAALLIPVILAAVATSMDISKLLSDKGRLSSALDAASLATASALTNGDITTAQAQDFATRIASGQISSTMSDAQVKELKASLVASVTSQGSGSKKDYTVKVTGKFTSQLLAFSGFHALGNRTVSGSSTATSQAQTATAISLYLVVDESGSMAWPTETEDKSKPNGCYQYPKKDWDKKVYYAPCYVSKIASLKTAATALFDQMDMIEASDATNSLVRAGVNSFSHQVEGQSDLDWGTKKSRTYVSNLPAKPMGGTDMTEALDDANAALNSKTEAAAQAVKGNATFKKFIVLMTDGENTGESSEWKPALDAKTLNTCASARAAGVTIFTVAYMAPPNGETLLKSCAGEASNYYKATDMPSLIKAFNDIGGKVANQTTRMTN
ncbi:Flp pilus assembly protein TadG [Rhizobium aquaticum]|uniref:Flp pilus assembly protein TadG n=1 Tax=Rhizobium aquaticum TaxID=1549636 RepID=A0ABV2J3S3_9HYPH